MDPRTYNLHQPYVPPSLAKWAPLMLLVAANLLLLTPVGSVPRALGAGLILLMPGFVWTKQVLRTTSVMLQLTVAVGLSYLGAMLVGLLLHYLPGSIPMWSEIAACDIMSLPPILLLLSSRDTGADVSASPTATEATRPTMSDHPRYMTVLLLILVVAAFFRFTSLGYSEFQGDEALAMITASQSLEGHQDALFLRGKGPGEVLLPMMLWGLAGTLTEAIARLPFAVAGWMLVLTGYLLTRRLFSSHRHAGWIALVAAALFSVNGFGVAFSRIVQYQSVIMWMSALTVLCAWEWYAGRGLRWLLLASAFAGVGLLAHYDAILALPAVLFLVWSRWRAHPTNRGRIAAAAIMACACFLLIAGAFYVPYAIDPQAARTGGYLGDRIGDNLLKNNLGDFQAFNIFYTSAYYYMITGALVLGFCAWVSRAMPGIGKKRGLRFAVPLLVVVIGLAMALWPTLLKLPTLDLAVFPFVLILVAAFVSRDASIGTRTALAWLAVPFLGYNFGVALPLTHIYTIVPAWILLSSVGLLSLGLALPARWRQAARPGWLWAGSAAIVLGMLFGGYLWIAYLRHSLEFRQDWPQSRAALYWTPFADPPRTGFFGFPHQTGWKGVGSLYVLGSLAGDYISNEEPDVTAWYTRGAARACDNSAEYYFAADSVVDAWPVDTEAIAAAYGQAGRIVTNSGKGLTIFQLQPTTRMIDTVRLAEVSPAFDRSAVPAAFANTGRSDHEVNANLGDRIELVGYDMDPSRVWPGGRVTVTIFWRPTVSIDEDLHVFVHLESQGAASETPRTWAQADGRPVCWSYPTFDWRPGQIIADHHSITLPHDLPLGDYYLRVGMYAPETGLRLDVLAESGEPLANFIDLAQVTIRESTVDAAK